MLTPIKAEMAKIISDKGDFKGSRMISHTYTGVK